MKKNIKKETPNFYAGYYTMYNYLILIIKMKLAKMIKKIDNMP